MIILDRLVREGIFYFLAAWNSCRICLTRRNESLQKENERLLLFAHNATGFGLRSCCITRARICPELRA